MLTLSTPRRGSELLTQAPVFRVSICESDLDESISYHMLISKSDTRAQIDELRASNATQDQVMFLNLPQRKTRRQRQEIPDLALVNLKDDITSLTPYSETLICHITVYVYRSLSPSQPSLHPIPLTYTNHATYSPPRSPTQSKTPCDARQSSRSLLHCLIVMVRPYMHTTSRPDGLALGMSRYAESYLNTPT